MGEIRRLKTWVENGELKEVQDDVLFIIDRLKQISPRLKIYWNEHIGKFTITETDLEGTERLVFNVDTLDQRVVDRMLKADQWRGREDPEHMLPESEDFLTRLETEEDEFYQAQDVAGMEKVRMFGEEFAAYLELDGRGVRSSILVPRNVGRRG